MASSFGAVVLLLCASFPYSFQQVGPLQILQSKHVYGPDGPWHAVTVGLGNPVQTLDLYPGGTFGSQIITNLVCTDTSVEPCGSGGLYNLLDSTSAGASGGPIDFDQQSDNKIDSSFTNGALLLELGNSSYTQDTLSIPNSKSVDDFDIYTYSFLEMIYPDGTHYPIQVGMLSLGTDGADYNQTFTESTGSSINSTLIPNNLYQNNFIPSSSYGLHYGSAAFDLSLSLWLGGYDASRIVGPVSSQSYQNNGGENFELDLLDIGIAVDHGASPFNYTSKSGFLASGNTTISDGNTKSIPVLMNFAAPYLNLPNSTCNAIAQELPVTYSSKYGLYLWNVDDPQYKRIITSPTYLYFSFPLSGDLNKPFTINVPFQLLNLTLDTPLSPSPLQYFPCQPPQDPANQQYGLGRAFLQAAFIGVNWGDGQKQWFLAQAPGPDISSITDSKPIENGQPPTNSSGSWVASWNSSWTPLAATNKNGPSVSSGNGPSVSTQTPAPNKGLSGGAIAGIVVGAGVAALIGVALSVFVWRRKRASSSQSQTALMNEQEKKEERQASGTEVPPQYMTAELPETISPSELHNNHIVSEISSSDTGRYEMSTLASPKRRTFDP